MKRVVRMNKPVMPGRLFVLVLVFVILVQLTGCSAVENGMNTLIPDVLRTWRNTQGNNDLLSVHGLVQKVADAIRNDSDMELAYNSIPDKQLDGVTLDQFQQYITFLRRGVAGDVTSFGQMSESELSEIRGQILTRLPAQQALVDSLQGFWLYYQEVGRIEEQFGIFVQAAAGDTPTLSSEWIRKILDFKDLTGLYFDAIYANDIKTLSVLYKPLQLSDDILTLRAEKIVDFYQNNISTRSADFRLAYARIDSIAFDEYGITNPDKSQSGSRTLSMVNQPDGSIQIHDIIPEVIKTKDLQIYFNDKYLLKLGEYNDGEPVRIRSSELESIIGAPKAHDDTTCITAANGSQKLTLDYGGLNLKAEGSCFFRHSRWDGQIKELDLLSDAYRLASGLRTGMSDVEILKLYPFANETDFNLTGLSDSGPVQIQFIREAGIITSIKMKLGVP